CPLGLYNHGGWGGKPANLVAALLQGFALIQAGRYQDALRIVAPFGEDEDLPMMGYCVCAISLYNLAVPGRAKFWFTDLTRRYDVSDKTILAAFAELCYNVEDKVLGNKVLYMIATRLGEQTTALKPSFLLNYDAENPQNSLSWFANFLKIFLKPYLEYIPIWDGAELRDRHLLLTPWGGLGDHVMLARYFPMLKDEAVFQDGQVTIMTPPELLALYRENFPALNFTETGEALQIDETSRKSSTYQAVFPLYGLYDVIGVAKAMVCDFVKQPLIKPPKTDKWREILGASSGLRLAIAWNGKEGNDNDEKNLRRKMSNAMLLRMGDIPDVQYIMCIPDAPEAQRADVLHILQGIDASDQIEDVRDLVGIIGLCDGVICVDTLLAHVAGSMGKPVFMANRFDTDPRWLPRTESTKWYPSMHMGHQRYSGAWHGVADAMVAWIKALQANR
ncbi:MAG: hypothetical protein AAF352_03285, partial [Pseudomonadota bacterium]